MANQETWLKLVKFLRTLGAIICIIIVTIVALAALDITSQMFYPAGLETKNTELALAFVFDDKKYTELPSEVEFSIDGTHSIFRRGDGTYEKLRDLFNSTERHEIGLPSENPLSTPAMHSGELIIRSYGITSHFSIRPMHDDPNAYEIWLPHLNRGGKGGPIFTADRRIIDYIKARGTK